MLHAIGQALDKNNQTDVIYLDFAKAFDSVDHTMLLAKLRVHEASGDLFAVPQAIGAADTTQTCSII